MSFSKHCNLCENEIANLQNGVTCKLTMKKPDFKGICPKINFNEKFITKIETTNLKLERIRQNRKSVHLKFYILIIVGFILINAAFTLYNQNLGGVYALYYLFGTMSVGFTILAIAYTILNKFRRELYNQKLEKEATDEFLKKYKIEYLIDFHFKEEIHGIQEVVIKMEFKNWKEKYSSSTYKINY